MTAPAAQTPFTLAGYRTLVAGLLARGYSLRSFLAVEAAERHLLLRHDVDQSITIARTMADLETANGWYSTWFILLRTEMYNPFSRANAAHLRTMAGNGHEIGLHLDTTLYADDVQIEAGAAIECRMLEDIVGAPVRLISFHRPAPDRLGDDARVAGRLHAYMSRFTKDIGYCSDSRGEWRHGHPFDHPAIAQGRALQLLTHAVWWVGPEGRDARARLADVLTAKAAELDAELAANNVVWAKGAG
jgi:hypothetical protein